MQRALYEFAAWDSTNYLRWGTIYLEDAKSLSETAPFVYRNFMEGRSFSIKDKPGRFTAIGGDQKLEQTINLSSKCSDGVIGHAKRKQYVAQWDLIYDKMMAVKNLHCEYTGVSDSTPTLHHHESSQSITNRKEGHIQEMIKYIEERGSPFSAECPSVLQNFVTKEMMTEEIRNDVLNASERGEKKYEAFHTDRIIRKTLKLNETIHRLNIETVVSIKNKPLKTTKKVIKEMIVTDKSIQIARDRGLGTEDLLKYDVVPSPMLFDDDQLMTKPEKSQLIRELQEKLCSDDYSYTHKPESAFVIDVMAAVRRLPLSGLADFSDLLSQLTQITDVYHRYGRCDYIFDIYSENPSVKDSERLRRSTVTPVTLSTVEQTTPLPKDISTFWPSSKNKLLLEKLIYNHVREKKMQNNEHPTILSQLCMNSNDWPCINIHGSAEHNMQDLESTGDEADLRIPMHVLDCVRSGYKTCVVISNDTMITALLFYVPVFLQEGVKELWVQAGRGTSIRYVPLHTFHERLGHDLCSVLPALHNLTGCDISSKIGTKKAAIKADPEIHLQGFGTTAPITTAIIQQAEKYLVNVVDAKSKARNFQELRANQFYFCEASTHQNLPPTSEGLKPHIQRAYYNAYTTMHILDKQLGLQTGNLDPVDYGFTLLENGILSPSTSWKTLETYWFVMCNCGKCARAACPCRKVKVHCSVFCKCQKMKNCKNPFN